MGIKDALEKLPPVTLYTKDDWHAKLSQKSPRDARDVRDIAMMFLRGEIDDRLPTISHLWRFFNTGGIVVSRSTLARYLEILRGEIKTAGEARKVAGRGKAKARDRRQGTNKATRKASSRAIRTH